VIRPNDPSGVRRLCEGHMTLFRYRAHSMISVLVMALAMGCAGGSSQAATRCDTELTVEAAVAPEFPPVARKVRAFGYVNVTGTVDETGAVTAAEVAQGGMAVPFFKDVSLEAAKRWRFKPRSGCPVKPFVMQFMFKQAGAKGWGAGTVFKPPATVMILIEEVDVPVDR